MMVAALFFFSCEEEIKSLGYKANARFDVLYKELPIESSVFLIDSLNTTNYGSGDRFLVGKYIDDDLGNVTASAFSQYFIAGSIPDSLALSTLESVTLRLAFDYYNYGSGLNGDQTIEIYELAKKLHTVDNKSLAYYYSRSDVAIGSKIGDLTFAINPTIFNENQKPPTPPAKTPVEYREIVIDKTFGAPIFESAQNYETTKNAALKVNRDTVFVTYSRFVKSFKGIAIKPVSGDKILGFNPASPQTKLVLHLRKDNGKPDSLVFSLSRGVASFSQILSDKSGDLFSLPADMRYVQNGVGIVTKLDLSPFLAFADTIPQMVINSAEILIDDVPSQSEFQRPPIGLGLRVLNDDNSFRNDTAKTNLAEINKYKGTVSWPSGTNPVPIGYVNSEQQITPLTLPFIANGTEKNYIGFTTLFLQELYNNYKKGETLFSKLALYSNLPQAGKTVERVGFHKDNIKLRIYYTLPIIEKAK